MDDLTASARWEEKEGWDEFVQPIAAAAQVPPDEIAPATPLEELGIDSLAFTELVVTFIVDFGMETLEDELDRRDWSIVTVGELYEEFKADRQAQRE